MTFHADVNAAEDDAPWPTHDICMCCGEPSNGPLVGYDIILPGQSTYTRALFHRDCAFAMAQRIICDAWPKRRAAKLMENNR